jgi:hypothetical protein
VLQQKAGAKQVHHPIVGDITVEFDVLELLADPGSMLYTYSAEPRVGVRGFPAAARQLGGKQRQSSHPSLR